MCLDEETLAMLQNHPEGWDCDCDGHADIDMDDVDEEDSTGDWQRVALDRFGRDTINLRPWRTPKFRVDRYNETLA